MRLPIRPMPKGRSQHPRRAIIIVLGRRRTLAQATLQTPAQVLRAPLSGRLDEEALTDQLPDHLSPLDVPRYAAARAGLSAIQESSDCTHRADPK